VSKKIMVQGHGPSKVNRDPKAPSCYEALKGCHVAGVRIEELPENLVAKLAYQHTDEGIHEWKAAMERGDGLDRPPKRAAVTATEFGRSIEERRDFRQDAGRREIFEAPDPMKELVEEHIEPGMRAKFLSPGRVERDGTRGFEVVKDSKGDPVKMGRMVLGQMPEAKARARATFYQKKGSERLSAIEQEHKERQRELVD
jgi:hypothetical protein